MPLTFGSGLGQIAGGGLSGGSSGGGSSLSWLQKIEDSCMAMELFILASWRRVFFKLHESFEREFIPWTHSRCPVPPNERLAVAMDVGFFPKPDTRRSVNSFAAEFFAKSILGHLGIRTARSRIVSAEEARKLSPDEFITKFEVGNRLRWRKTGRGTVPVIAFGVGPYALATEIVREAATIDFIRRVKFDIPDERSWDDFYSQIRSSAHVDERQVRMVFQLVAKKCRPADSLFSKFEPAPDEWPKIRAAIDIFGDQYLRIAAARIFLGITCGHFSNVLVTRTGELVSLDHDSMRFESGEDLEMLFRFVRRGSRVFNLLGEVAALTDNDVRAAVAEIPDHPSFVVDAHALAGYFVERVALWRRLYASETVPARAVAV